LIQQLLDENRFYPTADELGRIRRWVRYNLQDILTTHIESLTRFRGTIR
jgi:hypothetical protein